jgi:hypothetical protein
LTRVWRTGREVVIREGQTSREIRVPLGEVGDVVARLVKLALATEAETEWDEETPVESPSARTRLGKRPG